MMFKNMPIFSYSHAISFYSLHLYFFISFRICLTLSMFILVILLVIVLIPEYSLQNEWPYKRDTETIRLFAFVTH